MSFLKYCVHLSGKKKSLLKDNFETKKRQGVATMGFSLFCCFLTGEPIDLRRRAHDRIIADGAVLDEVPLPGRILRLEGDGNTVADKLHQVIVRGVDRPARPDDEQVPSSGGVETTKDSVVVREGNSDAVLLAVLGVSFAGVTPGHHRDLANRNRIVIRRDEAEHQTVSDIELDRRRGSLRATRDSERSLDGIWRDGDCSTSGRRVLPSGTPTASGEKEGEVNYNETCQGDLLWWHGGKAGKLQFPDCQRTCESTTELNFCQDEIL